MRLTVVSVTVKDQEKAKAFYRDILGFSVEAENPMGDGNTWIRMNPSKGRAGITLVTWLDKLKPGGQQGLVLETGKIEKAHAKLKAKGLKISSISKASWGSFATFADPDGNGWVLAEMAATPLKPHKYKMPMGASMAKRRVVKKV